MGGFFGFGQSGGEKQSTSNLNNIFNYALPAAESGGNAGGTNLNRAGDFFSKLLTSGRQETAQSSAPAVNAVLTSADARKRQEATTGTGRTGGTAEVNHERGAGTDATIDNIINQNLVGQRQQGAEGLTKVGSEQQANAARLLGIGSQGQQSLYTGSINKEIGQMNGVESVGQTVAGSILAAMGFL